MEAIAESGCIPTSHPTCASPPASSAGGWRTPPGPTPPVTKSCVWQPNALIRLKAMLGTSVNPTDGLRFEGRADWCSRGRRSSQDVSRRRAAERSWQMASAPGNQAIREAFTFDDVLLKPGLSDVLPSQVDIRSHVTRAIPLNIPIMASAMDTVTEARMAIAMAQAGGVGVIHRNFDPEGQAAQVRQVKKFESGMVVNPLTIAPDATLADALALMKDHGISGIPLVTGGAAARPGKLGGILTNRDVRFATDPRQKVSDLMTHDKLVTVREGVGQDEAKRMLHQHRI